MDAGRGGSPLAAHDPVRLGRHRILSRLGSGGMGQVFLAEGPLGMVAIKTVHPHLLDNPQFRLRFQHEIQASFRVRSSYAAQLLDFDTTSDPPWLATEFVDAPDLEVLVGGGVHFTHEAQLQLALGLAEALVTLHEAGIVHRDLKPSNIICAAAGPKVIDFGIASAMDAVGLTGTYMAVGTAAWMSPERFEGTTTPAADVYAWGALISFAASGLVPYEAKTMPDMFRQVMTEAPRVDYEQLYPPLRHLVATSLLRDPANRPSAEDLRDALLELEGDVHDVLEGGRARESPSETGGDDQLQRQVGADTKPPGPAAGIGSSPAYRQRALFLAICGGLYFLTVVLPWNVFSGGSLHSDLTYFPLSGPGRIGRDFLLVPTLGLYAIAALCLVAGVRDLGRPLTNGRLFRAVLPSLLAVGTAGFVGVQAFTASSPREQHLTFAFVDSIGFYLAMLGLAFGVASLVWRRSER